MQWKIKSVLRPSPIPVRWRERSLAERGGSSPRAFAFKDDFSNAFPWTFSNLPFMVADDTGSQREGA